MNDPGKFCLNLSVGVVGTLASASHLLSEWAAILAGSATAAWMARQLWISFHQKK
jgi:hypothetical protein